MKDIFSKRQRFSLRKLTIGVCSVLLGTTIFATNAVAAEEVSATAAEATTTAAAPTTTAEATTEAETTAAPSATEETTAALAATEETTTAATAAEETSRTRSRRAASQGSDNSPVDVETTLKDGETATPDMSNPNGATVKSQDVPDASFKKADSNYTFHILDLTKYNARYNTNYYTRAYKPFSDSNNVTVELVDKNTGSVIETVQITETSGKQSFQKTKQASNGELTLYVVYGTNPGKIGRDASKFIQFHYDIDPVIQTYPDLEGRTPENEAKMKIYQDVYNARTSTDIFNATEPAYNGRTITDTNALIPQVVNNTTLYKIVDKSNPTYQAGRTETSTQSYKESGKEEELASYKMKAMEGQNFNASGVRQFDGYRLYQAADPTTTSGYVSSPYKVGTKFMDADRYGIKRIKEVVDEDGTVVIRVYLLDPKQQSKRSDGTLSTDGYMLIAETQPIKPGNANTEELAKVKSTLNTIAFTGTDGVNHPNGIEVGFDFQKAAGYTPYKTVFVPFLGDRIGHGSPNSQLERGVGGIGTNVDLLNTLTPFKQPVYYYEKVEPVKVKPEFKKTLEGRNLVDGEFSFTIKEQKSSADGYEETVQNADGKVSFSELTFNKVGTYKYKITEKAGSDANVDYDAMEITMTVEVTQDAAGVLKTKVTYSAEGGETSKADDQEFNNFVVPPVSTKFDFTKKLEGRPLKDQEFSFVLKDAEGNEIETVKNDADGNVTFTSLNYDKTKVGVHKYTVEEVIPATKEDRMDYDTMKANITVTVTKSGHVLTTVTSYASEGGNATGADDREFNNKVTPPPTTPEFKPEKFVVNKEKFDITGDKLMDDDNELTDEVAETNANPYADKSTNNEPENINGKTLKKGDKFYYQVWLDTTKFTADQNIQYVGITDDYEEDKLDVTTDGIKVYDSVSGADVTSKFDIKVEDGKISATSKAEFVNENSVIDTTKFEFGRYYKFDIAATIKTTVKDGIDIENTASQIVHVYDPYNKTVEKPEKPTQKRVVNIPVSVDFNFTKKLEGRTLKDQEFTFVLKDAEGTEIETVKNDKDGNVKFKSLEFTKNQVGTHKYTIEEAAGSDATVTYDTMKAEVTITVNYDGTAKVLTTKVKDATDKEFNNTVTPPETPEFKPEKFIVNKEKFDVTGDKLVDDDKELTDKVAETNANPYVDDASNNEAENLNTKTVKPGDKLVYQVWLDTTKFDTANKDYIQSVGITDDYDEAKLTVEAANIKAYDSVTGEDVTDKFDITVNNGVVTATSKTSLQKSLGDAENTQVLDTTKFAFGRYYKFDIVATVKEDVTPGADIENTAVQVVNQYDPTSKTVKTPEKPTQKRVVNIPVEVEFNFTKKLQGRELKEQEFSFVLKDAEGTEIETVKNDKDGNVKFKALEFNKNQAGTYKYTIEEVAGSDATVTYDKMKAEVTVEVKYDGTAKALITKLTDAPDKEFNNVVTPPDAPNFKPEKFILTEEKYDITGDKLMDDDNELTDEVADTNANPYADKTTNNEAENLNTKTVKRGSKVVYQVWLDTNNFTEKQNIQSVGITDDYDEAKLTVDAANVKAYDSKTGEEVTNLFDITVEDGVIKATSKASLQKSLGDAEDTQVLDTTKFAFGRYYKFDIVATVKEDVTGGADIENTATQIVHQYDPTSKSVVTPEKPTQKRVINVPIEVEFNFTKKLEGRELKENEFTFVLKDAKGTEIETVKNDVDGNVKFKAIEYNKDQAGTYKYTIEEVAGTDGTVTYDTMKAEVTVEVKYDGTAKALITKVTDAPDKEFNNTVTPPETPEFQPKKFVVKDEKFDITGDKLADDDKELTDAVTETNANPYADTTDNNEAENLNTKTVKRGDKLVYQVWLDTNNFTEKQNIQSVGITDDYDEAKLTVEAANVKAYDSKTGADVTDLFDITVEDGVIKATSKASLTKSLGDAEDTQVIDTEKFAFDRYYKFDIVATVKEDVAGGSQIENTATQIVHQYDPTSKTVKTPEKPTEKRVNQVPIEVEFDFTKKLEGRELAAGEFSFVLKDAEGNEIETVKNDKDGKVKFSKIEFKKGDEGTHKYTVEEVAGTDATVTYDTMKAEITVEVSYDGTAKILVTKVTDAADKEFNNTVTPPETPEFQPKKFVVKTEKFDTTGDKLVDDDAELTDAVTDTKADPYADKADNNEAENINTSTLKKGDKVVYQVWLDTTKFDANNKDYIQSVGITDNYDEENLTVDANNIKAYDSVTGEDVTAKFDIKVENGVITATSKADLTKSLGDAENTQVLDTTKFAFGLYYKFDIVATIKETAKGGVDIENTASQTVHQYDPTKKSVEKPEKPTETRVVNIPTKVEFEFTKKLEGRPLKDGEFSFVLKDKDGNVIETVTNDADGKIKFSALTFKRGEEGVYTYTVEEVKGTEEGVTYDTMVATVTVTVAKDGKVLTAVAGLPEDTEFNNTVTPPNTPNTPPQTPPTPGKPELPNTGVEDLSAVFNAASMSLLAGLGLLATGKKKEDEEE